MGEHEMYGEVNYKLRQPKRDQWDIYIRYKALAKITKHKASGPVVHPINSI